jgi:hypothetical protein
MGNVLRRRIDSCDKKSLCFTRQPPRCAYGARIEHACVAVYSGMWGMTTKTASEVTA